MKNAKVEIGVIAVGTLLSLLSLAVGTYDPLWTSLGIHDPGVRSGLTTALSLLFLLLAFLLAIYSRTAMIETSAGRLQSKLQAEIPQLSAFRILDANSALQYIESQLPVVRSMINTKIVSEPNSGYLTDSGRRYATALDRAITNGLQLREIVNEPWKTAAIQRRTTMMRNSLPSGAYEVQCLNAPLPSFLNFTVLRYRDGREEVLFGWAITKGRRFDQKCFLSTEPSLIAFFEAWFSDLYSVAEEL